jgi:soluble cytochrome b562
MNAELNAEQRAALVALVGEEAAKEDEQAVAKAYQDFRAGMESLLRALDHKEAVDGRP